MGEAIAQIVLIGAGQLGSRHLQGLACLKEGINITVIDPNPLALQTARSRYNEMPVNKTIKAVNYVESVARIKDSVDVAIIATNADVRRKVIEDLLNSNMVKYLVLEKVVFQSVDDFNVILALLKERKIKAWVNFPRRIFPFFRELRKRSIRGAKVDLSIQGSNWGLACNAIHMLDLLAFISGQKTFMVDGSSLDRKVYKAKRKGFIELGGELRAESNRGDTMKLIDDRNQNKTSKMFIHFDGVKIEIDQVNGWFRESVDTHERQAERMRFQAPLQSELTSIQVEEILKKGNSRLTPLRESFLLHRPLLDVFNLHISNILKKPVTVCPIT